MNNFNENNIKPVVEPVIKTVPENVIVKSVEKKEKGETENNALNIIIGIIIAVGILFVLFYLGKGIINRQNKSVVELDNKEYKGEFNLNGNTCYDLKDYFIVTKPDPMSSGSDILVKYKTAQSHNIKCEYYVEINDFELKNTCFDGPVCYRAQWFKYIKDDFLIVDLGTGTSRSFEIYNLDNQQRVFTDNYSGELFDLQDNILTYWRTTNDIPNKENCSKVDEYKKIGGAKIETKVFLNVSDLTKKEFSEFRCSYAE